MAHSRIAWPPETFFFRFAVGLKTKLVLLAAPPPLSGPETMVASHNFAQLGVVANVPLNANY